MSFRSGLRSFLLRQEPSFIRNRKLPELYAVRATRSTRTIRVRVEAERSTKSAAAATHKMKRKPLPIAGSGFFITAEADEGENMQAYTGFAAVSYTHLKVVCPEFFFLFIIETITVSEVSPCFK